MSFADILSLPIDVEFLDGIENYDDYPQAGMRATIVSYKGAHDCLKVRFDFTGFEQYNKQFETSDYYDKDGNAILTAREAGCYNPIAEYYLPAIADWGSVIKVLDSSDPRVQLAAEYTAEDAREDTEQPYVRWLEDQVISLRTTTE